MTSCHLFYFPWFLKTYPGSSALVLTSSSTALRVVGVPPGVLGSGACVFQRPLLFGCFQDVGTKKVLTTLPAGQENNQFFPQLSKNIPLVCFCLWLTFISKRVLQNMGTSCTEHVSMLWHYLLLCSISGDSSQPHKRKCKVLNS